MTSHSGSASFTGVRRVGLAVGLAAIAVTFSVDGARGAAAVESAATSRITAAYTRPPLVFERTEGPLAARATFLARGQGYAILLGPTEAALVLSPSGTGGEMRSPAARTAALPSAVVRMRLVGADPGATVKGLAPLPSRSHYLIGNDQRRWRANVVHYGRVEVESVYPGVNVVYYGNQRQLEYDFVVAPGAEPGVIRLVFDGAKGVAIDGNGDLVLRLAGGELRQHPPLVYQEIDGKRREVRGRYALDGQGHVRFEVAAYDTTERLVIDPTLAYSTYLGGSGTDFNFGVAVDGAGNAYVTGMTLSSDFPTANPVQPDFGGAGAVWGDAFVTKFNAAGSLVYSTYLGGSGQDFGTRIAVDGSGHAYVAGETGSTDFPTANALQPGFGGGFSDAFVTKLSPDGSALVYSTYLGGASSDSGFGIAVDASGNAYVSGDTFSTNFPTANAFQPTRAGFVFNSDAFVTKLNPAGSALVYSTYLGGTA
jgi:hypothetical protein